MYKRQNESGRNAGGLKNGNRMDKETAEEIIRENRYPSGYDIQDYLSAVSYTHLGKWFWQSEKDKDLVILREWVEPGSNQLLTNSQ